MPYSDPERQREYQNEWMRRRRQDWLAEHGPCVDCGSRENLQIDHVDPATKITHRVFSWSASRRETELAKCVVRCESCHKVKTVEMGERAHSERNGMSKLNANTVREIRASPLGHRELARIYGVDESNIRSARLRKTWRYVE